MLACSGTKGCRILVFMYRFSLLAFNGRFSSTNRKCCIFIFHVTGIEMERSERRSASGSLYQSCPRQQSRR